MRVAVLRWKLLPATTPPYDRLTEDMALLFTSQIESTSLWATLCIVIPCISRIDRPPVGGAGEARDGGPHGQSPGGGDVGMGGDDPMGDSDLRGGGGGTPGDRDTPGDRVTPGEVNEGKGTAAAIGASLSLKIRGASMRKA
mmetsp:Transcript_72618/g.157577  ORF Transcript_72618/g.157577 Transcript_72618/m.157577 type:complete len:141 (-) Transcript_72618:124-546(-)